MKKIILFLIMIVSIIGFSVNFSSDKKYHPNEIAGSYRGKYENIVVKNEKGKLTFFYNDGSKGYFKPVGDGLYIPVYTTNKNYHGYAKKELYFA